MKCTQYLYHVNINSNDMTLQQKQCVTRLLLAYISYSNIESICQNVKILQNTPPKKTKYFITNNQVQTLLFLLPFQMGKQSLFFMHTSKMAEKLFLTWDSCFDEEIFFTQHSTLFFHYILHCFYHISTVKSELSLAYYILP